MNQESEDRQFLEAMALKSDEVSAPLTAKLPVAEQALSHVSEEQGSNNVDPQAPAVFVGTDLEDKSTAPSAGAVPDQPESADTISDQAESAAVLQNHPEIKQVHDRLSEIVAAVEAPDISLDAALNLYEEAVSLGLKAAELLDESIL